MNIFYLDRNPMLAARYHCDKHVLKMIVETAQLLSTAWHCLLPVTAAGMDIYKKTHWNHPCAKWVRCSQRNYLWAFNLFCALLQEYEHRYHKVHACNRLVARLCNPPQMLPLGQLEPLGIPQAMPDEFKHPDPVVAYRRYYTVGKAKLLKYTNREVPSWVIL